ncbi:methylamine utilization protein [Rubripirellula reticaptiva]|uniref:methylamine utilization protein n=1 Tax=Rubripirellula reticaptiva TaxID=2528013 RepID=UPI001FE8A750|nr:methylamine utilization protein [Rubripirellula reticaptiva]
MKISTLRHIVFSVAVAAAPFVGSQVNAEETGDLKIRFEYGGTPPKAEAIDVNKDVEFCGRNPLIDERLIVNPDNKGIKNVVVYVYTGRGGTKLPDFEPAKNTHTLANENCRFEPHIVVAQVGDTLEVTNPDAVGHNANLGFFNNKQQNFTIPSGQSKMVELEKDEPAPIPVDCNIHPWMKSFVVVLEHPFAAVSNADGEMVIKGLPVGTELVFRAYHESGSISDVTINGKKEEWKRSRFETTVKAGENDMGTVVIPAEALKSN